MFLFSINGRYRGTSDLWIKSRHNMGHRKERHVSLSYVTLLNGKKMKGHLISGDGVYSYDKHSTANNIYSLPHCRSHNM